MMEGLPSIDENTVVSAVPGPVSHLNNINADPSSLEGANKLPCGLCGFIGCDLRIQGCGCHFHTRCCALPPPKTRFTQCPLCNSISTGIILVPLSFHDMDEAKKNYTEKQSKSKRAQNRKRKKLKDAFSNIDDAYDRRTGRWTQEEIAYVDELINTFDAGTLPLMDGMKLNDFLAGLLQCKQSRLTKKMKNAKLSSKSYERSTGVLDAATARVIGELEDAFFQSIQSPLVRSEMRFHMQKNWRELFSNYCVHVDQPVDASQWLSSIEELERRASASKDNARRQRRKLMMRCALNQDSQNPDPGVFIENNSAHPSLDQISRKPSSDPSDDLLLLFSDKSIFESSSVDMDANSVTVTKTVLHKNAFLSKVLKYLKKYDIPFEHVDAWVPSYIAGEDGNSSQKCRLCFAGADTIDHRGESKETDDQYHSFVAFGEYSERFSFAVGCGLPGRVYQSGIPTWEQSVQNAPFKHFERCGGAMQYGISTVVGIPIPSPNVGRIVLILYSDMDHPKNPALVTQLCEEFACYLPSPKWRLVVECDKPSKEGPGRGNEISTKPTTTKDSPGIQDQDENSACKESDATSEIIQLLGEHMPSDSTFPGFSYLAGFMSLRLMLLRSSRSPSEEETIRILKGSYRSYCKSGRQRDDIASLLARDCMFLTRSQTNSSDHLMERSIMFEGGSLNGAINAGAPLNQGELDAYLSGNEHRNDHNRLSEVSEHSNIILPDNLKNNIS